MSKSFEHILEKIETINEVIDAYKEIEEEEKRFKNRIENLNDDNYKKIINSMFNEEGFYIKSAENVGMLIGYETYIKEYGKNLQGLKDILAKKRSEKDAILTEINEKKAKFDALSKEIN